MDHSLTPGTGAPRPVPRAPIHSNNLRTRTTKTYCKGDIWFVNGDPDNPPVGTELWSNRPGVIVSNDVSSNRSGFVQIVYLTTSTRKRSGPTHVEVGSPMNDDKASMALCEQIHTVDTSRLVRRIGVVEDRYMHEIDSAICFSLSIGKRDDYGLFKKWEAHIKENSIDMAAEIAALSATTTDARVEALTRAVQLIASERDSLRRLLETNTQLPSLLDELRDVIDVG